MFRLNILISALLLYITVAAVESTNTAVKVSHSWTEVKSNKDHPPLYGTGNHHPSLKTIFVGENNHSLALLKWNNITEAHPSAVKLTVRTHTFDGQGYDKICDIASPPEDQTELTAPTSMVFLRGDRILLSWTEKNKEQVEQLRLQVISTDTCKSSDYFYIKALKDTSSFIYFDVADFVMRFKDNFEILVRFPLDCLTPSPYDATCKYAIDYDGKPLTPKPELMTNVSIGNKFVDNAHGMKYNGGEGYVFFASNHSSDESGPQYPHGWFAYTPISDWILLRPDVSSNTAYYSNSSGFASVCWMPEDYDFHCKWLDGTHDSKETMVVKLHLDFNDTLLDLSTVNSPNGHVVLLHLLADERGHFLAADEVQSNGQCKRVAKVAVPSVPKTAKLSVGSENQYCFSYITEKLLTENPSIYEDTFASQCTPVMEEASVGLHPCCENYK